MINNQISIENAIIQEVIDDIMSLTKAKVYDQKLWEEIKKFQESKKKLEEEPTKRNNWYKKFSTCQKGVEQRESNRKQLKVLYENKKNISTKLNSEGEPNKLNTLNELKKNVSSMIMKIEKDISEDNIELWHKWTKQIIHERKTLEQDRVVFSEKETKIKSNALEEQAIEIKNKCFEYNKMVSSAQPQEEKYSKLIPFKNKIQPQELDHNKWTTTTPSISFGRNF